MRVTRGIAALAVLVVGLGSALTGTARAAPRGKADPRREQAARRYEAGVAHYASGKPAEALEAFREALLLHPDDDGARSAVRRLEAELEARPLPAPAPRASAPDFSAGVDRLLLEKIPRWFHFNRSVGDALSRVGTVHALNGRVAQLLAERKLALARRRPFPKDKQLRALLRRVPSLADEQSFPT